MDEKARTLPGEEQTDIFLCTRELPDKLTAETAALRQLCAALAGEGYRVFFPPALPKELTDEERAQRIVASLRSARVMVAAGVGREGLTDVLSQGLWGAFLKSGEDAADRFFLCWRDQGEEPLPALLEGRPLFDMGDLQFLAKLKTALAAVLPPAERDAAEREGEDPETETMPGESAEPEEVPAEEIPGEPDAPAEEAGEAPPAETKKPFPWKWVLLAAAALGLILWLIFK